MGYGLAKLGGLAFCALGIFDRWVYIVVIDIGFQEISIKRLETSFFVVVAWIYCIYMIDESLDRL